MAQDNLKDVAINWIMIGLLFFSLMSFSLVFIYGNEGTLGDEGDFLNNSLQGFQSKLIETESDGNVLLNISSESNPEVSDLGSRDSVATSYSITGTSKDFFSSFKLFLSWIFSGTSGQLIISVFGGVFAIISIYFITKWIRQGV